jgi:hypothetical protein
MAGSAPARIFPANVTHAIRGKVTIGNVTGKFEIGTLPAGAMILALKRYIVTTLFNGTTPLDYSAQRHRRRRSPPRPVLRRQPPALNRV